MKSKKVILILMVVLLLPTLSATLASSIGQELREVRPSKMGKHRFVPDEILVKFKGDTKPFRRIKVPAGNVLEKIKEYLKKADIEFAEPNFYAYASWIPNDPYYSYQWHFYNPAYGGINMEETWQFLGAPGTPGKDVVVAVVDTGVAYENYQESWWRRYEQAPDLADTCFVAGYDFVNNDSHPNDDSNPGHGTHVAGTIAQSTNNGLGVAGIAFNACLMPVKVLNSTGAGTYADVVDGIRWAVDNGAHVINLSLGGGAPSAALEEAVAHAYNNGVTVIAATGNDGTNVLNYPAAYDDYVIAVGATRYDESLASYSNFGPSLDVVAPGGDLDVDQNGDGYGDGVLQQTYEKVGWRGISWGYYFMDGTSMAAPHVSGVAALLIANRNATSPDEIRAALQETAEDLGNPGRDDTYGWGLIDAYAALMWSAAPNEPPVADDQLVTTDEDKAVAITLTASDPDGDEMTYSVVSEPSNGTLTGTAPDVTYTPNADYNGPDSFTFKANDGKVDSNIAAVDITINPVNDQPVANDQAVTTEENTLVDITLTGSDVDADDLTYSVVSGPSNGTLAGTPPDVTYTPNDSYIGLDSFTFKANDGKVDSNTATVSITVTEVNHPPVADDQLVNTDEDTPVDITLTASDPDGDEMTYSVVSDPSNGTLTGTAPNVTYTPNDNYNGPDSFTFKANDGKVDSNTATVSITINPVNDQPVAHNQAVTTEENTSINITLTGSDVDGDDLTYSVVTGPSNGTLSGTAPNVTYTPNLNFHGSDSFTFVANDGKVDSVPAKVSITVRPAAATAWVNIDHSIQRIWVFWRVIYTVTITENDASGSAISGATVYVTLSGDYSGTATGTTDNYGKVSFGTEYYWGPVTITFTVNRVVKNGQEYILAGETSEQISGASRARSRR